MNKVKTILFDSDGVLLKKQGYFSDFYCEQYGVPKEDVISFFRGKFGDCQRGTLDIKEELPPFLEKWKWDGTVEDFLNYWFSSCTKVDQEILEKVQDFKKMGASCYLVSDQEKYRGKYIKEVLGLEKELDGFFYSFNLGHLKSEAGFFEKILERTNFDPKEMIFFDDEQGNIEVAKKLGIEGVLFKSIADLKELEKLFNFESKNSFGLRKFLK